VELTNSSSSVKIRRGKGCLVNDLDLLHFLWPTTLGQISSFVISICYNKIHVFLPLANETREQRQILDPHTKQKYNQAQTKFHHDEMKYENWTN